MIELHGDWIGYYTFDQGYNEVARDRKVPFKMNIRMAFSEFVGMIEEDIESGGIDDDIIVKGRQSESEIEFTKFYTREHYVDERGLQISVDSDQPNVVFYYGEYDYDNELYKGQWEVSALLPDETEEGIVHEYICTGFWYMWREKTKR